MATIAATTGIGRGDVPRSIRRLEKSGLLRTESGGGLAVNIYTIVFDTSPEGVSSVADGHIVSAAPLTGCQQIGTGGVSDAADLTDQEQTKEQTRAPRAFRERVDDQSADDWFETFWRIYPSRRPNPNPKEAAREEFATALKRGADPTAIVRGAENY